MVEARALQDPISALQEALRQVADAKRKQQDATPDTLTLIAAAAKRAGAKLLLVLDQFEEFVILGKTVTAARICRPARPPGVCFDSRGQAAAGPTQRLPDAFGGEGPTPAAV